MLLNHFIYRLSTNCLSKKVAIYISLGLSPLPVTVANGGFTKIPSKGGDCYWAGGQFYT